MSGYSVHANQTMLEPPKQITLVKALTPLWDNENTHTLTPNNHNKESLTPIFLRSESEKKLSL